jgi:hypothetical protein
MADETRARRRGLQLFSPAEPVNTEQLRMEPPVWDQPAVDALPEFFSGKGSAERKLFVDPDGTPDNRLSLLWLKLASNYQLPRHSHTGDCLYYVVTGEVRLGNRTIEAGGGFFVPSDAPYSYVAGPDGAEVLEFRSYGQPINSRIHETPSGWKRILEGVRANRDRWVSELKPYAKWQRSVSSVPYETPDGERKNLAIEQ